MNFTRGSILCLLVVLNCIIQIDAQQNNLLYVSYSNHQNQQSDVCVVYLLQEASHHFDSEFDAHKFLKNPVNISSLTTDGLELSINGIPTVDSLETIILNIETNTFGSHSLTFQNINTFESSIHLYLEDQLSHTLVNLREIDTYTFQIDEEVGSFGRERFLVHFSYSPYVLKKEAKVEQETIEEERAPEIENDTIVIETEDASDDTLQVGIVNMDTIIEPIPVVINTDPDLDTIIQNDSTTETTIEIVDNTDSISSEPEIVINNTPTNDTLPDDNITIQHTNNDTIINIGYDSEVISIEELDNNTILETDSLVSANPTEDENITSNSETTMNSIENESDSLDRESNDVIASAEIKIDHHHHITLYPDPSDGTFVHIKTNEKIGDPFQFKLYDMSGNIIYSEEGEISGNNIIYFNHTLNSGNYPTVIKTTHESLNTMLIVK